MVPVLHRRIVEYNIIITQDYYGVFIFIFVGEAFWAKKVKKYTLDISQKLLRLELQKFQGNFF